MGRMQRKVSRFFNPSSFKTFPQDTLFVPAQPTQAAHVTPAERPAAVARDTSPFSPRSPATNDSDWDELAKSPSSSRTASSTPRTRSSDLCSTDDSSWVDASTEPPCAEGAENGSKGRELGSVWRSNLQELGSVQSIQQHSQLEYLITLIGISEALTADQASGSTHHCICLKLLAGNRAGATRALATASSLTSLGPRSHLTRLISFRQSTVQARR
ncbi:hypothetical protein WJX74_008484 [Apatococcus lobatus]|uniref:Uncharacterized protein n=1 Tax=Apatococcus lobatus TaxID=904363 RepID=A0AAW1RZ62_9CHLO